MIVSHNTPIHNLRMFRVNGIGEWFFAFFLFAGYFKMDPRFIFIQAYIDITLLFLCLSLLIFLYRWSKNSFKQRVSSTFVNLSLLFFLFEACLISGLLYTQSRQYGFEKAMRFVFLTGWAFFGAAFLISDHSSLKRFSWALVTISTAMSIDALLSYPGIGRISFVTAFGSNYIALARASGLGLLVTMVFLLPTEQKPLVKLYLWIIAALQLWATFSAGARGPVLALILSFLLFFILSIRGFLWLKIDSFTLRLGILTFFIIIILTAIGQELFPTLMFRSRLLITETGDSAAMRLHFYQTAFNEWCKSPIWGNGTGYFGIAVRGEDIREYPHNIILEIGTENGLLGVLIFLTMIGIIFIRGLFKLYNEKGLIRIITRYLLVMNYFALLNAMVSGDINDNRILFTFIALLSMF